MNLGGIVRTVQGAFLHEAWADRYGVTLTDAQRDTVNLRTPAEMFEAARPIEQEREPGRRVVTNCRGFTVVTVAMLRERGVEARARCGFGRYFMPERFEDHWVVEYRDGSVWRMADAQIDEVQRTALGVDFDLLDMPREQFVTGPQAWRMVRNGEADPDHFGLSNTDLHGIHFVVGNLLRDRVAVDHDVVTLPWDVWEPMPEPGEPVDGDLFDRIADGTAPVEAPAKVYNLRRERTEDVTALP